MKRFTETTKWDKPWFHELDPVLKCLWLYICDNCDAAGVWEPNYALASFIIGKKVTKESLTAFGGRVMSLSNGKVWLESFITFQYGKLSKDCRPHLKIFESLNKHGIDYIDGQEFVIRSRAGHVSEGKRTAIYARDGGKCVYCGSQENLEPDHIVSRKSGGSDAINNLVTACHDCNTLKNDKSIEQFLSNHPDKHRVLEYVHRVLAKPDTLQEEDKDKEEETEKEGESRGGADDRWFPEGFRSPEFKRRFGEWEKHLLERGKPLTPAARRCVLGECVGKTEADAVGAITFSLTKNTTYLAWDWKKDAENRKNGATTNQPPSRNIGHNAGVSYANRPNRQAPDATDQTGGSASDV